MTCKECIHYDVCKYHAEEYEAEGYIVDFDTRFDTEIACEAFKDKSRYIELPCKAGDILYDIYCAKLNGVGDIQELKVPEIHIKLDKHNKPWIIISGYYFAFEDFGKYTFFTKEEAEKALAERVVDE